MGGAHLTRPAAFLDRDGVLNRAIVGEDGVPRGPLSVAELELIPEAVDGCRTLRRAGFLLIAVTNQPDVARGLLGRADVEAVNDAVMGELDLDDLLVCYHDDVDDCPCRKPRPGMLIEAAGRWHADLESSVMIGDRSRDVEAGHRAGCLTVLVGSGYGEPLNATPDMHASDLDQAANLVVDHLWGGAER